MASVDKVCESCRELRRHEDYTTWHNGQKRKDCDKCWAELVNWALRLMRPTNG